MRDRLNKIINYWLITIMVIFIIFIFFSCFFKYHKYLNYQGTIIRNQDNYYIKLYVGYENLNDINNRVMYLNNEKSDYNIIKISNEYYIYDNKKYKEIIISASLKNDIKIENNVVDVKFQLDKITLMVTIIDYLKEVF